MQFICKVISITCPLQTFKGFRIFVSDSQQNLGISLCCIHDHKPLGHSEIPWRLQGDRLSDYQDIYYRNSKFQNTTDSLGKMSMVKPVADFLFSFWGTSWSFVRASIIYYPISQTLIIRTATHLRFVKTENIVKQCLYKYNSFVASSLH